MNLILTSFICVVMTVALPVSAEISADEVARLGVDLTPLGGEKAGNPEGTSPLGTEV